MPDTGWAPQLAAEELVLRREAHASIVAIP
jgi:hypothetical protein